MKKLLKSILIFFDDTLFRILVKYIYPKYQRPRQGYAYNYDILRRYFFMQKIMGFNRRVPWPVDFRSKILGVEHIEKGIMCDPGDNIGIYINAYGGLTLGNNVNIGQNTIITTTNHDIYDHRKISDKKGVTIGDNVWIGANCCIVAGVIIGDNVTIGAGCTIRQNIPSNSLVVQDVNTLTIKSKKPYQWDCEKEELL
jgi:acetyltransferase-like isoleucine patch superfamily enzyme|tara:strand:- start:282 stop:872 length:591 start_codon:yes stop_codon:yes gene_type:complete